MSAGPQNDRSLRRIAAAWLAKKVRQNLVPKFLKRQQADGHVYRRTGNLAQFDPQNCTVEPEGLKLLQNLVREAAQYPGPIIEIGTLLGITATHMALAKSPRQRIITVDNYCWNPWGLPPDAHHGLTQQMLLFLVETGQVEQIRMDKGAFFASYQGPSPSLVFLDAWHTYEETKKDIEWAIRAGAKLIAGHDYCAQFPGVQQIVDECGGPRDLAGSVWVLKPSAALRAAA
jgi:hypothetical protein